MKTKLAIALLCILPTFPLIAGCENQSEVKTSSKTAFDSDLEEQMVSDKEKLSENQTLDSSLEFLQQMVFHEVSISFPCQFNVFSDTFTLGNGFYFGEANYTYYELLYHGEKVASIGIAGEKTDQNNDREVVMMIIEDEQLASLEIAGEPCNVDMSNMIDRLGAPNNQSVDEWKSLVEYTTDRVDVTIIFNDNQADEITFVKKGE